eukprot:snap_masked-scaffold_88-processed-gene-0.35-mRNA-1 protein AED:1.00 eAED:1.00 QI:0/-1/0/0/-1/1/1/0/63
MSLMWYKRDNWNNLNSEEKKRITKDLRSSAKEDYNNWLHRIAAEIETVFQSKSAKLATSWQRR